MRFTIRLLLTALTLCLALLCPVALPFAGQQGATAQRDRQTQTVYITRTGKKYHCDGCRNLASSRIHRVKVLLQAVRESNQRPDAGPRCGVNPMPHAICVLGGDGFAKIQGQEPHRSNDWIVYCDLLEQNPLLFRQMLCWSAR